MRFLAPLLLVVAVAAAALPIDDRRPRAEPREGEPRRETETRRGEPRESRPRRPPESGRGDSRPRESRRGDVPVARCPAGVAGCRAVRGRVLYVERVDPDGDGDLHVVVLDGSITAPGMTAVDVRAGLRPRRDPRVGDRVSAAGPVQRGSYGQSQIHALEFHTRRR